MKKANIILSAIGLLSVIGGALAFKAQHRFSGTLFCYTTVGNISGVFAPVLTTRYTTTSPKGTLFCTVPEGTNTYKRIQVAASN
ncbi:hypothetical protein [Chitinophaga sancti]|uniref:Uncharacterized protein n=1 Tax=Chitinophaga sancti TaxID=1004 RepID=A0A1K1T0Q3_9BACT|nr:hypothetical protein [Chitinophaga sancti]WQD59594.1 hypothetical protein U0033_17035 [Chitinophaga sancti]WQG88273.1 hypothetical protein SR876_25430 [Chitinophaga sancti]SFW90184.1 hypothetical protein SAMN05661012_06567 [Chitinophaga sancti]